MCTAPTHYYVRVSRAASFTGTGPSSQVLALLHIARRGPRLAPPLTSFEPTGCQDDTKEGKRPPAVPSATTGPLPGEGLSRPPRQRAYLRVSPSFAHHGEEPGSRPLYCSPQRDLPAGREAAELGPHGGGQEQGPSPRRAKLGNARR